MPTIDDTVGSVVGGIASAAEGIGQEFDNLGSTTKHILEVGGKTLGHLTNAATMVTSENLYQVGKNATMIFSGAVIGSVAGGLTQVVTGGSMPIVSIGVGIVVGDFAAQKAGEIYDDFWK